LYDDGGVFDGPAEEPVHYDEAAAAVSSEGDVSVAGSSEVAAAAEEEEAMVVTGSRIRRPTSFAPASAVDIIDRNQLERSGATNMADVVASLGSAQGSGFQGGGDTSTVSAGTVAVNLRGLGTGATLVLINGRRMVPSGAGTEQVFADLSVMPLAAVERIELLKGGGSALYGADAIGGVINIITRKNWEGARAEVDTQSTTRLDQNDVTVSGGLGVNSERARATVAFSYFRRTELTADERDFTRGKSISIQGSPGTYYDLTNPKAPRFADPGCMNAQDSMVVSAPSGGATPSRTCVFDFRKYVSLLGNLNRTNMFANAEYDLTPHTTVYAEVMASRMRADGISSPSYPLPTLPVVPANHVDNPFGRPVLWLGRPLGSANGAVRNEATDDTMRLVSGVKGDFEHIASGSFLESWGWELFGSWGTSRYSQLIQDNLREPLQTALNSCSNPADLSRCFNPFYSATDGTGTPNSQAVINSFSGTYVFATEHTLHTYNAGLNGQLFKLPGGEVGVAVGGEVRREWRTTQADHDAELERYGFLIGNRDAKAQRNVYSGYLEVLWPFLHGLELQTAVRVEHYDDIDTTTPSPFAGITLTPADILGRERVAKLWRKLQLRGSVTQAFRAPTVYQSNPGYSIIPTQLTVAGGALRFIPVQGFGNPDLHPERALVASTGFSWQPVAALLLSSEFWSYTYRDRIVLENAQQAVTTDESLMASGQRDLRVVRDATNNIERVRVQLRNFAGTITTRGLDFGGTLNLGAATLDGVSEAWGALSLGFQGTYTLTYDFPRDQAGPRIIPNTTPTQALPPPHCGRSSCEAAGSRNAKNFAPPIPRWRLSFPVSYSHGGHMAAVITRYISKLEDDNAVSSTGSLGTLDPWVTVDVQYGYVFKVRGGREIVARIGVYNLFDAAPPPAVENAGFEPLVYDPRGRMAYAKLSGRF
jgi:iron complex outermembrane receptor protein